MLVHKPGQQLACAVLTREAAAQAWILEGWHGPRDDKPTLLCPVVPSQCVVQWEEGRVFSACSKGQERSGGGPKATCADLPSISPQPPPKLPSGVFSPHFQEFVHKW